jgi:hypothetical protein
MAREQEGQTNRITASPLSARLAHLDKPARPGKVAEFLLRIAYRGKQGPGRHAENGHAAARTFLTERKTLTKCTFKVYKN